MILPPKTEIQLWNVSLNADPVFYEKCKAALTDAERDRISFYNFKQVQDNYVISQGGLRLLLSQYLNIAPQQLKIGRHAKGKPFSIDEPSLCFNMSNSGSYCIYAFSSDGEVGIDIEDIRPLPDLDELIEKNFTLKEKIYINKNEKDKLKKFFRFWTIKEAYLKAIGEGMRLTPDRLEFSVENELFKLEAVNGIFEQDDWLFKEISFANNYVGTVVYKGVHKTISEIKAL